VLGFWRSGFSPSRLLSTHSQSLPIPVNSHPFSVKFFPFAFLAYFASKVPLPFANLSFFATTSSGLIREGMRFKWHLEHSGSSCRTNGLRTPSGPVGQLTSRWTNGRRSRIPIVLPIPIQPIAAKSSLSIRVNSHPPCGQRLFPLFALLAYFAGKVFLPACDPRFFATHILQLLSVSSVKSVVAFPILLSRSFASIRG
jgi:hypothetical protein